MTVLVCGYEQTCPRLKGDKMKARERWTENLKCSRCGKVGEAKLSRAEIYAFLMGDNETSVDFLPDGFSPIREASFIYFNCVDCQVRAIVSAMS
jgi:hypothetical protein